MQVYFENPQDVKMDQFVATGHNGRITDYQNNFSLKRGSIFWPLFFYACYTLYHFYLHPKTIDCLHWSLES